MQYGQNQTWRNPAQYGQQQYGQYGQQPGLSTPGFNPAYGGGGFQAGYGGGFQQGYGGGQQGGYTLPPQQNYGGGYNQFQFNSGYR